MCGIAGFYTKNDQFSKTEILQMIDSLRHRGPDANGYFLTSNNNITIGLGHTRLSILDLSDSANQPFYSSCGRYIIIYNGEVYNFKELQRAFGIDTRTTSDTEVILELFVRIGTSFVSHLNGMFAIVIYDKSSHKLFLFRDRIGVKPLFFLKDEAGIIFSSELKAFNSIKPLRRRLTVNKIAINLFMHLGFIPHPYTIYNEINKFPPGSYAEIEGNSFTIIEYWKPEGKIKAVKETNKNSAKKQLQNLVEDSVRLRLVSDVPLGTFLSGGIDSSLVTAVAQKFSDRPIKTFSIGFKETSFNETTYSQRVASFLKTDHYEYILSEKDAQEDLFNVITHYDEPFADTSALPTYLVSKMARRYVAVVLTGDGGDESFMGYGAYSWAERLSKPWFKLLGQHASACLLKFGSNRLKRVGDMMNIDGVNNIRTHIFSQEQYFFREKELLKILTPEFSTFFDIKMDINNLPRLLDSKEEQALFDLNYYLQDDLLVKVDRATMLCSLEAREPLLDYRILEWSLNLDSKFKINRNINKYLLKEVLYEYIPESYFKRPKWGFSIPLAKWLKGDLSFLIDIFLSKEKIEDVGVIQYEYVETLIKRFRSGEDYLFNKIWQVVVLQSWFLTSKMN